MKMKCKYIKKIVFVVEILVIIGNILLGVNKLVLLINNKTEIML